MKKIFTLISMALVAMSVNAQTWIAAQNVNIEEARKNYVENSGSNLKKVSTSFESNPIDESTPEKKAASEAAVIAAADAQLTLKDYTITADTEYLTLKAVSTPNSDKAPGDASIWKFDGNTGESGNQALDAAILGDECLVDFGRNQWLVAGTGNPSMMSVEYFFYNTDRETVGPRYVETYWTNGCNELPAKGCYYEFTAKAAGTLIIGFFLNSNLKNNPLYIIDKSTKSLLAKDKISISAFRNNYNYEMEKGSSTRLVEYTLNDDYTVNSAIMGTDTNRKLMGYVYWDMEANSSYIMMSPKSQMGIYGFDFQTTDGIENVKTAAKNSNAPIYNLAGQKVDAAFKGMVIMNGKKFINK